MAHIKSVAEAVLERTNECVDAATKRFSGAIRPIYGSNERGRPDHIGSCVLLMLDNAPVLLTAAHVLDHNGQSSLYVGGDDSLVQIEGDFLATTKREEGRAKDHFDFAARKLQKETVCALGNVTYITERDIVSTTADTTGHVYLALGYPNTKNRKLNAAAKYVCPQLWKYSSTHKPNQPLATKLGVLSDSHYFLGFDKKHSKDASGNIVNSIDPKGISGGALIDLGNLANPANLLGLTQCEGFLAGLLIEFHACDSTIVATRLQTILQGLRKKGF